MNGEPAAGELRSAARGGAITLVGAVTSALLGFAFSVLLAKLLGSEGSGVVLQAIAAFTIAASVGRIGLDTCAVWILPPMVHSEPERVRATVRVLIVLAAAGAVALALLWWLWVAWFGSPSDGRRDVVSAMSIAAAFLPAATVMMVGLAATRAFGGVGPFNLVSNLAVPALRVLALAAIVGMGGGVLAVVLGWGAVWVVGALLATIVLVRQLARATPRDVRAPAPTRKILGYSLPRAVSSALEQAVIWLDVLLVGLLAGNGAAGVYGVASRFVAAGVMAATAIRIVVAPRFSALLAAEDRDRVTRLYQVTAGWILLFGAPVYLLLAGFAPTVLSWLGRDFDRGVPAMVILCFGSIVVLAAGNVQSLLLMSGRTSWVALNKVAVVLVNLVGNLFAIPLWGMTGAAVVWALSMLLDTALAVWQTRRATAITLAGSSVLRTATALALGVALPIGAVATVLGQGTVRFVVAAGLGLLGWLVVSWVERGRLELGELRGVLGSRMGIGRSASSRFGS